MSMQNYRTRNAQGSESTHATCVMAVQKCSDLHPSPPISYRTPLQLSLCGPNLLGLWSNANHCCLFGIGILARSPPKPRGFAVIGKKKKKKNRRNRNGEAGPIKGPASHASFGTGPKPKAGSEISS